jgi:hypothetical protein
MKAFTIMMPLLGLTMTGGAAQAQPSSDLGVLVGARDGE